MCSQPLRVCDSPRRLLLTVRDQCLDEHRELYQRRVTLQGMLTVAFGLGHVGLLTVPVVRLFVGLRAAQVLAWFLITRSHPWRIFHRICGTTSIFENCISGHFCVRKASSINRIVADLLPDWMTLFAVAEPFWPLVACTLDAVACV